MLNKNIAKRMIKDIVSSIDWEKDEDNFEETLNSDEQQDKIMITLKNYITVV